VDARSLECVGVGATRNMARSGVGAHATDELDIVGGGQFSAARFERASALGRAVAR
jgi:hypothetical protein